MAAIVLVHGGFCGGWIWRSVADRLRAAGHDVYAPTLTGLGERAHLASPSIDLGVHVADVAGLLSFEQLQDVVLVGHSYGGLIVQLVTDQVAATLARCIYVDALLLEDGESIVDPDLGIPEAPAALRAAASANNGSLPVPATTAGPAGASVAATRLTPHPFRTFEQHVVLRGGGPPATYLTCLDRPASSDPVARFTAAKFELARSRAAARGWECVDDPGSHFGLLSEGSGRLAAMISTRASAP